MGRQNDRHCSKEMEMTRTLARFTILVFALTMLSVGAFAGSKSQDITLYQDAQLNGKTLPAGDYVVKYEMNGPTAQVKFVRNGKEVASATGQVKQLTKAPESTQLVTEGGNGTANISEIDFAHNSSAVTFEASAMSAGSN
jgi:hypothetical protein